MNISILEPNLREKGGHNFDWTKKIVQYLTVVLKHNVIIYTNKNVEENVVDELSKIAKIVPHFTAHLYNKNYKYKTFATKMPRYYFILNELKKVEESDLWIIPTLHSSLLLSLIKLNPKIPISSIIHFVPNYLGEGGNNIWKLCGEKLVHSKLNINFYVTVPELIPIYDNLLQKSTQHIPYIFSSSKNIKKKSLLNKVGFFGHQREEKGLLLLDKLVEEIINMGLNITIQDPNGSVKLNSTVSNNITFLGFVDDLSEEITNCDLVISPYDNNKFHYRMSGLMTDALANAVPVIGPKNTTNGNLIEKFHAGETFDHFNVESILHAIKKVYNNYEFYANGAFDAYQYFNNNHGLNRFIDTLLNEEIR